MTDAPSSPVASSTTRPDDSALPNSASGPGEVFLTGQDARLFGFGAWAAFVVTRGFAAFLAIMYGAIALDIWSNVSLGDYTLDDLLWNTVETVVGCVTVLFVILGILLAYPWWQSMRRATTLDAASGMLVLTQRHILGFSLSRRLAFADLAELRVANWYQDDTFVWQLQAVSTKGAAMQLSAWVSDRAEVEALANRLRAALVAAGWTDLETRASAVNTDPNTAASP